MREHGVAIAVLGLVMFLSWIAGACIDTDDSSEFSGYLKIFPVVFGVVFIFAGLVLMAYSEVFAR